jgi:acyl-CoA reductase-like NAD-dependent aldehyde dehydrogenase
MTINGERVSADHELGVINPATGEVFASAPNASREQMGEAVAAAKAAGLRAAGDGLRVEPGPDGGP